MWLWSVLWRASALLAVTGTLDINFFTQNRRYVPTSQINCYEYSKFNTDRFGRAYNEEWRSQKSPLRNIMAGPFSSSFPINIYDSNKVMTRRFDDLLPLKHDIFKEHAKLVQDINSLKQVVFVAPLVDDNRDYDESIFHETIETFSTTTPKPQPAKTIRPTKSSSIPVILLGGASNRQIVRSQPLNFPKSTISLVGTTGSPLLKHPYPFVMQGVPQKPLRVCMPTMALSTTTRRPTLWERLIKTLIPR